MLSWLKGTPSRLKTVNSYARFVLANLFRRHTSELVVDLGEGFKDIHDHRYLYLVLITLLDAGYRPYVVWNTSFNRFRRFYRTYENLIAKLDVRFVSKCPKPSKSTILLTTGTGKSGWKKVVQLDCDISSANGELTMPYFMHPEQYGRNGRHRLAEFRKQPRSVRVFFSGSLAEKDYNNHLPGNKLTRFEIAKALQTMPKVEFGPSIAGSQFGKCVIADRRVEAVSDDDWLETIAKSDFFLCLPGSRMPICHNAVEAMAVGTIPILNYAEWFHPGLKHGENCIEFSSLSELRDRITEILNLDSCAVQDIREKVVKYYEDHLSPLALRRKIEESSYQQIRLFVNTGYPWETESGLLMR